MITGSFFSSSKTPNNRSNNSSTIKLPNLANENSNKKALTNPTSRGDPSKNASNSTSRGLSFATNSEGSITEIEKYDSYMINVIKFKYFLN